MRPATTPRAPRSPMLWAAVAFAVGIAAGAYAWRPPMLWTVAWVVFCTSCVFYLQRRVIPAFVLALAALLVLGAVRTQVAPSASSSCSDVRFPVNETEVTAHVTAEQPPIPEPFGQFRQTVDVQLESVSADGVSSAACAGVRLSIFGMREQDAIAYGQRISFRAKLNPPRNFRNPGAFDYKRYLAGNGISALAAVRRSEVTVLPGFAGNRFERLRTRARRSVLEKTSKDRKSVV